MSDRADNLSDIRLIQSKVKNLGHKLGRGDLTIGSTPRGDGSPYVEVGDAYYYIVEERGVELKRLKTADLDELLYWIIKNLTVSLAWDYEKRHRRHGEDSRRQAFAKDLELLASLSPKWAERRESEYAEILRAHPYHDS